MTFGHEGGDHALRKRRSPEVPAVVGADEGGNQLLRHDEIAEPETRKQHLAEAPCIEHPLIAIDALQGRQGTTHVTEFAIVIILDDKGTGFAGPGEEDRKSTRLNSSHLGISYAVFCLKK